MPPGEGWASDPFAPEIRGGLLHGRGVGRHEGRRSPPSSPPAPRSRDHPGTLSLIITGDEEGPATYGTPAIMDWMAERGIRPDMILIGEPTSEARLGDIVKIGRRGSVNMWITVPGVQGHVAYPHRADNPVPKLGRVIAALEALHLDDGNDAFQPSNLEITAVDTASKATNVIPGAATRPAQHPLQQPPARRRSGRAGPPHRRGGRAGRDRRGEDFGRGLPDPARADLRHRQRRDRGRDRRDARASPPMAAPRTAAS